MGESSRERPIDILLVEDNPGDVRLTREALKKEGRIRNELHVVTTGQDALDYLRKRRESGEQPRPDIVLLDVGLPDMDGLDVLAKVKESEDLGSIPVIILTASEAEEDIVRGYELKANAYMTKPPDSDEFIQKIRSLADYGIQIIELPGDN